MMTFKLNYPLIAMVLACAAFWYLAGKALAHALA